MNAEFVVTQSHVAYYLSCITYFTDTPTSLPTRDSTLCLWKAQVRVPFSVTNNAENPLKPRRFLLR